MNKRVKRVTTYCPIDGSSLTYIYIRHCFGWRVKYRYRMVHTGMRTIGIREGHLGMASVAKEYGDLPQFQDAGGAYELAEHMGSLYGKCLFVPCSDRDENEYSERIMDEMFVKA